MKGIIELFSIIMHLDTATFTANSGAITPLYLAIAGVILLVVIVVVIGLTGQKKVKKASK